jgi:hypothetical protein
VKPQKEKTLAQKFGFKPLTKRELVLAAEARAIPPGRDRNEHQDDLLFRQEVLAVSSGMTRAQWKKKFPTTSSLWWLVSGKDSEFHDQGDHWDAAHARVPLAVLRKAAAAVVMAEARKRAKELAEGGRVDLLEYLRRKWAKPGYSYERESGAS